MTERFAINSIKCFCVGCQEKIDIMADFEQADYYVNGNIYTYFSCPRHGSVQVDVNGKRYLRPSELFEHITIEGV